MLFGSHLYGTETENSDKDYKGIFMPSFHNLLLGRIPKSLVTNTKQKENVKNCPEDVDQEIYSLHYFLELAMQGETVALDMLHAPNSCIISSSIIWEQLVNNREKFYTRNLKSFVGYARKQAAKYGIKGSRLDNIRQFLAFLCTQKDESRLSEIWDELPNGEYIHYSQDPLSPFRIVTICGKIFHETVKVGHIVPILKKFYSNYGQRAEQARQNQGIDWKAISHAIRAALQVRQILTKNTIVFPLPEANLLRDIKQGKLDYLTEAAPLLDILMEEIETLSKESKLPKQVDREFWEDWLIEEIKGSYQRSKEGLWI